LCCGGRAEALIVAKLGNICSHLERNSLGVGTGNLFWCNRELERAIRELETLISESELTGVPSVDSPLVGPTAIKLHVT
jgi:hypothetical protein